jgi:hypothetical protein
MKKRNPIRSVVFIKDCNSINAEKSGLTRGPVLQEYSMQLPDDEVLVISDKSKKKK